MYFSVSEAVYEGNYKIKITFQNGKSGIADLEEYISDGEIYHDIRNTEKFKTENVVIIEGDAPGTLEQAGVFDRAFIGGSGGNIFGILDSVHNKIYERGRIVVTAVTLDTLFEARNFFSYMKYSHEIVQVAVTRITETAGFSMLKAQSPVFIISAEKGES